MKPLHKYSSSRPLGLFQPIILLMTACTAQQASETSEQFSKHGSSMFARYHEAICAAEPSLCDLVDGVTYLHSNTAFQCYRSAGRSSLAGGRIEEEATRQCSDNWETQNFHGSECSVSLSQGETTEGSSSISSLATCLTHREGEVDSTTPERFCISSGKNHHSIKSAKNSIALVQCGSATHDTPRPKLTDIRPDLSCVTYEESTPKTVGQYGNTKTVVCSTSELSGDTTDLDSAELTCQVTERFAEGLFNQVQSFKEFRCAYGAIKNENDWRTRTAFHCSGESTKGAGQQGVDGTATSNLSCFKGMEIERADKEPYLSCTNDSDSIDTSDKKTVSEEERRCESVQ